MLDHAAIRDALIAALEAHPDCLALWEGGSRSFGRDDARSDLDLALVVRDGAVAVGFAVVEMALERLDSIAALWEVPANAWHGWSQRFYQLEGAPATLLVDLCIIQESDEFPEDDAVRHGERFVLFDKGDFSSRSGDGMSLRTPDLDDLEARFQLFAPFVAKEVARGRPMDAWRFWTGNVIPPLIAALRARYAPARADFGARYLHEDLPPEVAERLTRLTYTGDYKRLPAAVDEAAAWFSETLEALRLEE